MLKRPQTFTTHYDTQYGFHWLFAETFVVLTRLADGLSRRFTYDQLGFAARQKEGEGR